MLKPESFAAPGVVVVTALMIGTAGCSQGATADARTEQAGAEATAAGSSTEELREAVPEEAVGATRDLVLAGGCFWCLEAGFEQLRGVSDVVSGYAGGAEQNASYRLVASGLTQHAEAVRITYDPQVISEQTLLKVFFLAAHDPTQLNRQGPDIGRQYRSAVFYASDEQKQRVQKMIVELNASGRFEKKITTTLEPLEGFYPAEGYHQDYAKLNPDQPYIVVHSQPKAEKVCKSFPELIRQMDGPEKPALKDSQTDQEGDGGRTSGSAAP